MKSVLVLCNQAEIEPDLATLEFDEKLLVNPILPNQNLNLHLNSLTHRVLEGFTPIAHDLLEIAAYIYYADCSIKRGYIDVFAERWKRNFDFIIPVSDPNLWNRSDIKNSLIEVLEFLTGDRFSFHFIPPRPRGQLFFDFGNNPFPGADCISLFSGGLDSLVGALFLHKKLNLNPLLVSHRSVATTNAIQRELLRLVRERNPNAQFPHLSIWINRMGKMSSEETQRSRAFLYLSTAVAVANQLDISNIFMCENGIVSINLPLSGQNIGTMLTRSTHPKFLKLFENLIRVLLKKEFSIKNPFIFFTKTQMLKFLKDWNQADLIQATISCSYTHRRTSLKPQCGTCSQCVGRRFSVIAAGLEEFDNSQFYEKDIFLNPLDEGRETAFAEGYIRNAFEINDMNDVQFLTNFPEVSEVLKSLQLQAGECAIKLYDLFKLHAEEVINTAISRFHRHTGDLLSGKLPENCLISILGSQHHLLNPLNTYANKIAGILNRSLRKAFQNAKPANEYILQDSADAALSAANERLQRESPELAYGIVRIRPDFSDLIDRKRYLFLELKLVKNRARLNKIVQEITSDIITYGEQEAFVLFVVYDCDGFIVDDDKFIHPLEKHEGVHVAIIR